MFPFKCRTFVFVQQKHNLQLTSPKVLGIKINSWFSNWQPCNSLLFTSMSSLSPDHEILMWGIMSAPNYNRGARLDLCSFCSIADVTLNALHRTINTLNINNSPQMLNWRCSINSEWEIDFVDSNFVRISTFKLIIFL